VDGMDGERSGKETWKWRLDLRFSFVLILRPRMSRWNAGRKYRGRKRMGKMDYERNQYILVMKRRKVGPSQEWI
jgi:hypothetical protein